MLLLCIAYNFYVFARFTKFWRDNKFKPSEQHSQHVKIISVNVYQFNSEYERFVQMIRKEQPDIFLTMESNQEWENAFQELKDDYPNFKEIALENTYGMHFYSKLNIRNMKVHYFVADDLPSIEAELETEDGYRFVFFGVHPPPPSPTEEETSKERDGDLLSLAKQAKKQNLPVVITGDFNTVAWSSVSILFKKASGLIDARYGRGYLATFHAKYWFFRIPLDLLYHSPDVFVDDLKILPSIGSDHFPMCCTFYIDKRNEEQEKDVKTLDAEEKEEVEELIEEGKDEESDNRSDE
nr:endonuclease/exonuclease/phosphatase family protein [Sphingobacterium bovistauri]